MQMIKEVKHFTHSDLDGIGCLVIGKHLFTHTSPEVCDYDNVNQKVQDFILTYLNKDDGSLKEEICPYELILITDISVDTETAMLLDVFQKKSETEVILLDHHPNLEWLNAMDWAVIYNREESGLLTSGTRMMMKELAVHISELSSDEREELEEFAETVRMYDTWDWNRQNILHPKRLNNLLYLIGRENFIKRFTTDLSTTFTESEDLVVDIEDEREKLYIERKKKELVKTSFYEYNVGIVFAEQFISTLGNEICNENEDIDFVIMINIGRSKVSYRSIRPDINVGAIAAKYFEGGGGHAYAAGSEFPPEERENVFKYLLEKD
jgi:uncharacterized protein